MTEEEDLNTKLNYFSYCRYNNERSGILIFVLSLSNKKIVKRLVDGHLGGLDRDDDVSF